MRIFYLLLNVIHEYQILSGRYKLARNVIKIPLTQDVKLRAAKCNCNALFRQLFCICVSRSRKVLYIL